MHLRIICSELWRCRQVTFLFQKPGNVPSCIHHCATCWVYLLLSDYIWLHLILFSCSASRALIVAPSAKMFSNYCGHLYNSKSCQFIPMISNYIYDKNILKIRDTSRCPKVDITGILNVFFTSVAQMTLYNHYEQTSASKLDLFDHYENKTSNMLTVCQHCYSSASAARILDILSQRYMLWIMEI